MGMTIDKAIPKLQFVRNALNDDMEIAKAYDLVIDTMYKYQKIQEIYQWAKDRSYLVETDDIMDKLKEVVEDGNVD